MQRLPFQASLLRTTAECRHGFCFAPTPTLGTGRLQHAQACKREQKKQKRGGLHITVECTCKLPVAISSATKPGDYLPVGLEDEHAASFVVHHNNVPVAVHRNSFGSHQLSRSDFCLLETSPETEYRHRCSKRYRTNLKPGSCLRKPFAGMFWVPRGTTVSVSQKTGSATFSICYWHLYKTLFSRKFCHQNWATVPF